MQAHAHLSQQLVTEVVAERVVDGFEVVQVDVEQRSQTIDLHIGLKRRLQALDQKTTVGQVGQGVVIGQMVNPLLGLLLCGDVLLDTDKVGDRASFVADRADDGSVYSLPSLRLL